MPRDAPLLPRIQALKADHPCWGDRRSWAYLPFVEQLSGNKKRGWRLRRAHPRLVQPNRRLQATRTPTGNQPKPTKPHEWWGSDLTKVLVQGFGWMDSVVGLDW
jgi:putative transposase